LTENKAKLLPLRRFALDGYYNSAYLSLLVQRNKLKAKRVGRNYFTTVTWFEEYLDCHARTETRVAYTEYFARLMAEKNNGYNNGNGNVNGNGFTNGNGNSLPPVEPAPVKFSQNLKILTAVVITAAVFILLFTALLINRESDKGQVAGENEASDQITNNNF
jgi:hypothetical protein